MCFSAQNKAPFVAEDSSSLSLRYTLCYDEDVRQVYESSFPKYFPYPRDIPDERMFTHPIWSTWAEFATEVNDSRVLSLAQDIIDNGFNNSQFEIDDNWETCYGDATFNPERFPDPQGLVDTLHSMGYRVTLWIHPFINNDCESFEYASENGFFLKDENGETQLTSWWQGDAAGYIDFTNNFALTWWSLRLENLLAETGMDSFKFDAGETSWMPDNYTLSVASSYWPNAFTTSYVDTVSDFGEMIEVRVGHESQQEPIFVRMLDKFSDWSTDNGLQTMIPSLLHSGLIGYPFVLPDMVGGNAYSGRPSAELFVRWAQSNTFMPAIQFSLLPWNYSIDVTQISRDVTELHASYAPLIIETGQNATQGAGPIARPTWWLCPQNEDCLLADQQFLLGDDILVTPVVTEAATSKDVVFPPGTWMQSDTGTTFEGPSTTTLSDITIESNIFFTRVS
ncbi:UNVERIFIED_CONTAM: hypothetical protein GTU68_009452 [Idotea baltica]|nr:hypothetical protein [Idotea baltica]